MDTGEQIRPPEGEETFTVEQAVEFLKDKEQALIEGFTRQNYWTLKGKFYGEGIQLSNHFSDNKGFFATKKNADGKIEDLLCVVFPYKNPQNLRIPDSVRQGIRLEFHFNANKDPDLREKEFQALITHRFTTTDMLHCNGVFVGNGAAITSQFHDVPLFGTTQGTMISIAEANISDNLKSQKINKTLFMEAVNKMLEPANEFPHAQALIDQYIKTDILPEEAGKRLMSAIKDFGNYMCDESSASNVGSCLTYPSDFKNFSRLTYRLNVVELDAYSKLPPEELYGGGEAEPQESVHFLNGLGPVIIDWTVRQFDRNLPFPYIYLSKDRPVYDHLKGRNAVYTPPPNDQLLLKD